jgi:tetratricopeptide (TPR) repeat protein
MNPESASAPSSRLLWLGAILSGLIFVAIFTVLQSRTEPNETTLPPIPPVMVLPDEEISNELSGPLSVLFNRVRYQPEAGDVRQAMIRQGGALLLENPTSEPRAVVLAGLYFDTISFEPNATTVSEHAERMRLLVQPFMTPTHLTRTSFQGQQMAAQAMKYYAMSYRFTRDFTAGAERLVAVRATLPVPVTATTTLPSDTHAYGYITHLIGYLYDMGGQVDLARQYYTEALPYEWQYNAYADTLVYLARLEQAKPTPDVEMVRTLADRALAGRPANQAAIVTLAEADIMSGTPEQAVQRLSALGDERCLQLCAHVYATALFAQYQTNPSPALLAEARDRAEATIIADENMAATHFVLGQILAAAGQDEAARLQWESAQASFVFSDLPLWKIEQLEQKMQATTDATSVRYYPDASLVGEIQ